MNATLGQQYRVKLISGRHRKPKKDEAKHMLLRLAEAVQDGKIPDDAMPVLRDCTTYRANGQTERTEVRLTADDLISLALYFTGGATGRVKDGFDFVRRAVSASDHRFQHVNVLDGDLIACDLHRLHWAPAGEQWAGSAVWDPGSRLAVAGEGEMPSKTLEIRAKNISAAKATTWPMDGDQQILISGSQEVEVLPGLNQEGGDAPRLGIRRVFMQTLRAAGFTEYRVSYHEGSPQSICLEGGIDGAGAVVMAFRLDGTGWEAK